MSYKLTQTGQKVQELLNQMQNNGQSQVTDAVLYTEQALNGKEREQARQNIGAVGTEPQKLDADQKAQARTNIGAVGTEPQELNDSQKAQARANIGAAGTEQVPKKVSELENDAGYTTNKGTVTQIDLSTLDFGSASLIPDTEGKIDLTIPIGHYACTGSFTWDTVADLQGTLCGDTELFDFGLTYGYTPRVAIWRDGIDTYYSYNQAYDGQKTYKLESRTFSWLLHDKDISTIWSGQDVWTDGVNTYLSFINGSEGAINRVWDKNSAAWTPKTWKGTTPQYGRLIWTDGDNIYYSYEDQQYYLTKDVNGNFTDTWAPKTWTGLTSFTGDATWTDGQNVYYSSGDEQYILDTQNSTLDTQNSTWVIKEWDGFVPDYSPYIWSDGQTTYYSHINVHYILDPVTQQWHPQQWNGLEYFSGTDIWTDGIATYCYMEGQQYELDSRTFTWHIKNSSASDATNWDVDKEESSYVAITRSDVAGWDLTSDHTPLYLLVVNIDGQSYSFISVHKKDNYDSTAHISQTVLWFSDPFDTNFHAGFIVSQNHAGGSYNPRNLKCIVHFPSWANHVILEGIYPAARWVEPQLGLLEPTVAITAYIDAEEELIIQRPPKENDEEVSGIWFTVNPSRLPRKVSGQVKYNLQLENRRVDNATVAATRGEFYNTEYTSGGTTPGGFQVAQLSPEALPQASGDIKTGNIESSQWGVATARDWQWHELKPTNIVITKKFCWGDNKFVAICQIQNEIRLCYSIDGIDWKLSNATAHNYNNVTYDGSQFIATYTTQSVTQGLHSADGVYWTNFTKFTPIPVATAGTLCYGDGKFVISTNTGTYYSVDGESWQEGQALKFCSLPHERRIVGYDNAVFVAEYDDCNPFGMIAGDFGEISKLLPYLNNTATTSTIDKFNTLSTLFVDFMEPFNIPTDGSSYSPNISDEDLTRYTTFYNQAKALYNSNSYLYKPNTGDNLTNSGIIGANYPYSMLFGTDITADTVDLQTVIAHLFGFESKSEFIAHAQNLYETYAAYRTNPEPKALENGCFYTNNGLFVFPVVVRPDNSTKPEDTVLAFIIIDNNGFVSVWIDNVKTVLKMINFNSTYYSAGETKVQFYCKNRLFGWRYSIGDRYDSIIYGSGVFVGHENGGHALVYSTDGKNWLRCDFPSSVGFNDMAYSNGKFVLVSDDYGDDSERDGAFSTNGINWRKTELPKGGTLFPLGWSGVAGDSGGFVAVEGNLWHKKATTFTTSVDGVHWLERRELSQGSNGFFEHGEHGCTGLIGHGDRGFIAFTAPAYGESSNRGVYYLDTLPHDAYTIEDVDITSNSDVLFEISDPSNITAFRIEDGKIILSCDEIPTHNISYRYKATHTDQKGQLTVINHYIPDSSSFVSVEKQTLTEVQQAQVRQNIGAGVSNFSGDYNDLINVPTIPTKVSELENDSGFTDNIGTITQIKINGEVKEPKPSGLIDLGNITPEPTDWTTVPITTALENGKTYVVKLDTTPYPLTAIFTMSEALDAIDANVVGGTQQGTDGASTYELKSATITVKDGKLTGLKSTNLVSNANPGAANLAYSESTFADLGITQYHYIELLNSVGGGMSGKGVNYTAIKDTLAIDKWTTDEIHVEGEILPTAEIVLVTFDDTVQHTIDKTKENTLLIGHATEDELTNIGYWAFDGQSLIVNTILSTDPNTNTPLPLVFAETTDVYFKYLYQESNTTLATLYVYKSNFDTYTAGDIVLVLSADTASGIDWLKCSTLMPNSDLNRFPAVKLYGYEFPSDLTGTSITIDVLCTKTDSPDIRKTLLLPYVGSEELDPGVMLHMYTYEPATEEEASAFPMAFMAYVFNSNAPGVAPAGTIIVFGGDQSSGSDPKYVFSKLFSLTTAGMAPVTYTYLNENIKLESAIKVYLNDSENIQIIDRQEGYVQFKRAKVADIPFSMEILDTEEEGLLRLFNSYMPQKISAFQNDAKYLTAQNLDYSSPISLDKAEDGTVTIGISSSGNTAFAQYSSSPTSGTLQVDKWVEESGYYTYTISDYSIYYDTDIIMNVNTPVALSALSLSSDTLKIKALTKPTESIDYSYKALRTNRSGQFTIVNSYMPTMPTKVSELENDSGYITQLVTETLQGTKRYKTFEDLTDCVLELGQYDAEGKYVYCV